ncbi:hypothetical protein A8713_20350 [Streptomyces sp. SAT1]|uniref:DUF4232 domain-containing protein n=1 Tax=Streptomyces sp. SAT1 TaxID=1849967 RepID=UPI0007DD5B43|nr:DUF4232 domain-containing protein [Streptomyces sp. SAT1]ANH93225.1 hypothetical protein A8713_20350 [Streptomyces sp. SAT1]
MRNHRKHTVLAVAAFAALSLGLTACGSGNGTKDEGQATTSQQATDSATAAATTGTSGTAGSGSSASASGSGKSGSANSATAADAAAKKNKGGSGTGAGAGSDSGSGSVSGSGSGKSGANAPACTFSDMKVTMEKADETPTEHIVLTATNKSSHSCRLLKYPLLAFGPIQTAKDVPAVAKSKPGAPVVLAPGQPAYANVRVANGGAHEDNKVVKEFDVNFFAADGPAEGSIVVHAPSGGLAVDEAVAKTGYWTEELRNGADEF